MDTGPVMMLLKDKIQKYGETLLCFFRIALTNIVHTREAKKVIID